MKRIIPWFPCEFRKALLASLWSLLGFVVVLSSGCSGGAGAAKDAVSGKVTLNGQAVAGEVKFVWQDKKQEMASPINPQGEYTILEPPPGKVKIVVKGMMAGQKLIAPPAKDAPKMEGAPVVGTGGVAPPAKYESVASTPLEFEVKSGKQQHNIELTP